MSGLTDLLHEAKDFVEGLFTHQDPNVPAAAQAIAAKIDAAIEEAHKLGSEVVADAEQVARDAGPVVAEAEHDVAQVGHDAAAAVQAVESAEPAAPTGESAAPAGA